MLNLDKYRHLFEAPFQNEDGTQDEESKMRSIASQGNPLASISYLLTLAQHRLRSKGNRLVFWLPTIEGIQPSQMETALQEMLQDTSCNSSLRFIRTVAEELPHGMWRWICVFEKT